MTVLAAPVPLPSPTIPPTTPAAPGSAAGFPGDPFRFTVDQYHRMIELGVIREDEKVELIRGRIIKQMTRKPPHCGTLDRMEMVLRERLPQGWRLRTQRAITTGDSEPEPDLAVVIDGVDRYISHHPTPSEIAMVGEVSDSTLEYDRTEKQEMYAAAGLPIYWIANVNGKQIEVYTDPTGPVEKPCYRNRVDYRIGDNVPLVIAGQHLGEIPVAALLPNVPVQ